MEQRQWERVDSLLQAALDLDLSERDAFLLSQCVDDPALLALTRSFLDLESASASFLEDPAVALLPPLEIDLGDSPSTIGKYRVQTEIGRGGMGVVYLAYRDDDEFRQRVALKILKRGMDSDEILTRFRRERQILAELDHPNIARLLDGGSTPEGLPYFAMEFVDGMPITVYCTTLSLDTDARLAVFQDVCKAIQYAHRHLVVHRDLKPSNVLVTRDGAAKLLDFGIAKLLNQTGDETRAEFRALTPKYASPEQLNGEPITTSSDVFSLGLILRELVHEDPVDLTRYGGRRDLEAIIEVALRDEPERRYLSVEQLDTDITRLRVGLPVTAQMNSIAYRLEKFAKRNKFTLLAVSGLAISVFGGLVSTRRQSRIASIERDRARDESRKASAAAEKANQINQFLNDMLSSADPAVLGKDVTIAQLLAVAERKLDNELADQPDLLADLLFTIGRTYRGLGNFERAEACLDRCRKLQAGLLGLESADRGRTLVELCRVLKDQGRLEKAEVLAREAVAIFRVPENEVRLDLAEALNALGGILLARGRLDESVECHEYEIALRRSEGHCHPGELATSLKDLAVVVGTLGDRKRSVILHKEALEIVRNAYRGDHPDVASAMTTLASAVEETDPEETERLFIAALRMRERLLGSEHPEAAWTRYNYAFFLTDRGNLDLAETLCFQVLALKGNTLAEEHPLIASSYLVLGRIDILRGDLGSAENNLTECLGLRRRVLDAGHWLIAMAEGWLAECLSLQGRFDEASKLFDSGLSGLQKLFPAEHPRYLQMQDMASRHLLRKSSNKG